MMPPLKIRRHIAGLFEVAANLCGYMVKARRLAAQPQDLAFQDVKHRMRNTLLCRVKLPLRRKGLPFEQRHGGLGPLGRNPRIGNQHTRIAGLAFRCRLVNAPEALRQAIGRRSLGHPASGEDLVRVPRRRDARQRPPPRLMARGAGPPGPLCVGTRLGSRSLL